MADRELPLADMGPLNPPPHKMTGLTEGAIYQAIRRYGVRSHYRATSADKRTRYAVFSNGKVASAPMSHAEAMALRDQMIARDILAMVEGDA